KRNEASADKALQAALTAQGAASSADKKAEEAQSLAGQGVADAATALAQAQDAYDHAEAAHQGLGDHSRVLTGHEGRIHTARNRAEEACGSAKSAHERIEAVKGDLEEKVGNAKHRADEAFLLAEDAKVQAGIGLERGAAAL